MGGGEVSEYIQTGIDGLDALFTNGIPRHSVNLIVGGPGSGKSILGLQLVSHAARNGQTCLYMTLEESKEQMRRHMRDFGWDDVLDSEYLHLDAFDAFEVAGAVETWYEKQQNVVTDPFETESMPDVFHLLAELEPDRVVVDSLSAIESGFAERNRQYRMYVNQFFKFFKHIGTDAFIIVESQSIPDRITANGQAEFLADGIILLHRRHQSRGIEVYKMRGSGFKEKIAPMEIAAGSGVTVHADESFFDEASGNVV